MFKKLKAHSQKLKKEISALYLAYRRKEVPWYAKAFAGLVIAYAFSPIDLIPDFIPVLGYLDDLVLIPLGISIAIKLIPQPIMQECRKEAEDKVSSGKPLNWKVGIAIILVWLVLAWFIISTFFLIR